MIGLVTPEDTAGSSALGRSPHPEQQTDSDGREGSVSASSRRAATPQQQELRPVAEDSRGALAAVGGTISGRAAGFDAPGDPSPAGSSGLRARIAGNAGSISAASTAELRTYNDAATGMVPNRNNVVERTMGGNGANRQGPDPDLSANPGAGGSQHARHNGIAAAAIGGSTRQTVTTINQLHKASVVGDLMAISRFIRDGGNLEAQSFCGRTALHYAAFYGHADVARALILGGANVCSRGGGNSTPLHFAAWGGNKKVVRLLLDYGADVEAHDTEGNAPQTSFIYLKSKVGTTCDEQPCSDEETVMEFDGGRQMRMLHAYPTTFFGVALVSVTTFTADGNETRDSAYSEDDELFQMLVGARRKAFPVPFKSVCSALESRPIAALGVYVTGIVTASSVVIGLVLAWISGEAGSAQSVAIMGTMGSSVGGARVLGAGESAEGDVGSDSIESIMSRRDVESVPVAALVWMIGGAFILGLAPALILAVGYKRRTAAFWRGVKERDAEILRIRHQGQIARTGLSPIAVGAPPGFDPASANVGVGSAMDVVGGSRPSAGATPVTGIGGGSIATPAAVAAAAADPFVESAPRQISRGEQAVQAVMARLTRIQGPPPGGAGTPRITPVLHARGVSPHTAPYAYRQALQPADLVRHQHDVRNSPAVAVAGTTLPPGGYIYGMAGNGAAPAMAGGVGRGMGFVSGMGGGAAIPGEIGGPMTSSHGGGGSGGRAVSSIQVAQ